MTEREPGEGAANTRRAKETTDRRQTETIGKTAHKIGLSTDQKSKKY